MLSLKNPSAKKVEKEVIHEAIIKHHHKASDAASLISIHESNVLRLLNEGISQQ